MEDPESEKNKAAAKIQSIQRGKASRLEQQNREKAAARIQSIQRGRAARDKLNNKEMTGDNILERNKRRAIALEQKMKEEAAVLLDLQRTSELEAEQRRKQKDEEPQSIDFHKKVSLIADFNNTRDTDFNKTRDTNFGCETRQTDFGDTREDEIRGVAGTTLNTTQIEKFSNFTKKDGHFTGHYPETTDALLTSPRDPLPLQQAQEELLVTVGQKQHKSVHSNYKYCKWFARKSNSVNSFLLPP